MKPHTSINNKHKSASLSLLLSNHEPRIWLNQAIVLKSSSALTSLCARDKESERSKKSERNKKSEGNKKRELFNLRVGWQSHECIAAHAADVSTCHL